MRDYGKVYAKFWISEDMRALTDDGRLLALYLMTCGHGTLAGIFHLPDGYVCWDMQWSPERVAKGLAELSRKGFATRCERTFWVWITKYMEWNKPDNPNQLTAAAKILTQVPNTCCWRADIQQVFDDLSVTLRSRWPNRSGTLSQSGSGTVTGSVSGTGTGTGAGTETGSQPAKCSPGGGGESTRKGNGTNGHSEPEPEGFAIIRARYPERVGDQRWSGALAHFTKNLQAGITAEAMIQGVERYASFCDTERITGTKYVQAAATFLGADRAFLEPWKPSEKRKHESPGERWAREGAKDASH